MAFIIDTEKQNKDKEFIKFSEKKAKEIISDGSKLYLETLKNDELKIKEKIIPHFNAFKSATKSLTLKLSLNNNHLEQKKLLKELAKLYTDESIFVAKCNITKYIIKDVPYPFESLGGVRFKDRAFEGGEFNACGGLAYTDYLYFSENWKNSESKPERDAYQLRHKMYEKLNEYNKYLDKIKDFTEKYVANLDEKLNNEVEKTMKKDFKEYKNSLPKGWLGGKNAASGFNLAMFIAIGGGYSL